jgi:membrane-bound inhibitor of C-type lysozyme
VPLSRLCFPVRHRRPALALLLRALTALGLGLNLTAAQTPLRAAGEAEAEQAIRATYLCRGRFDAVELTALFFNLEPSEVILLVGETATRLPRQLSASGSRYAGGAQEFWMKGDQADWRLGSHPAATMRCQTPPPQSQR